MTESIHQAATVYNFRPTFIVVKRRGSKRLLKTWSRRTCPVRWGGFSGSSQYAGPGPGSGSKSGSGSGSRQGCLFFSNFSLYCFNFCPYSPVTLYSKVRHLSFIYGGTISQKIWNIQKLRKGHLCLFFELREFQTEIGVLWRIYANS